ncbi:hypothetical protein ADIARSV_4292 [Arcticibacter svalbardensis MN12-7]|uniref:Uncharacterized protein n=1 Tax=Arcticibacter svalbardensis MN12-7 TaxID=1150600 RepID=R9GLH6_9SPHI|nr:hypothetical protein [Arcticibacter svalbardensis]EOR92568.1 hypothetical protein ADIARSV_4292 [Arcticibacter svalbardensis MN12-7]
MKILKTSIVILFMLLSIHGIAQTPNEKLELGVKKGLELMSAAQTSDGFLKAANHFERIAQVELKEWTPAYYAAYNNLVAGLLIKDKTLKDQYWDKALLEVDQADAVSPNNSEIYALKGYIQFMKMSIDPQARMSFMGLSAASLGKATALNPDNPRIYLIKGQDTFHTPEAFGGGKAKAKPLLEEAVAKFAIFKTKNAIEPNWGLEAAKSLLAQCN